MRGSLFAALPVIALGLLIAAAPYLLFPVCTGHVPTENGALVPMKCFWTARAALGCGGTIVFGGVLIAFIPSLSARLGITLMLFPPAILAMLLPTTLIGVCPSEMMPCRMGTLPALCLLGALTGITACVLALRLRAAMRGQGRTA